MIYLGKSRKLPENNRKPALSQNVQWDARQGTKRERQAPQ